MKQILFSDEILAVTNDWAWLEKNIFSAEVLAHLHLSYLVQYKYV